MGWEWKEIWDWVAAELGAWEICDMRDKRKTTRARPPGAALVEHAGTEHRATRGISPGGPAGPGKRRGGLEENEPELGRGMQPTT